MNKFLMLTMQEHMNLSTKYVMFNQSNLTCYWGNRDELTDKQRKIIKDLGYKYRGQNQWLYFVSYEPGYFPFNFDEAEVLRMIQYMEDLELALRYYYEYGADVLFDNGNMFLFSFSDDKKSWQFGEKPLPFTAFQFGGLKITNDELLEELASASKNKMVLEVDICPMVILANKLIDFIFQCGAPKDIRVSNVIIEAGLETFIARMHQFM